MSTPAHPFTDHAAANLPLSDRSRPIRYENEDATVGCIAYPINYDELYNLKGRLLTILDATTPDPIQRKALKNVVWTTLTSWMTDIEHATGFHNDPADTGQRDDKPGQA